VITLLHHLKWALPDDVHRQGSKFRQRNLFLGDAVGQPNIIVVDLADDIVDTSIDSTSCDWESDADVQAPPILEKVAADMAVEEISALLHKVPSTQPQHSETPEVSGSIGALAPVELVPPLCVWCPPWP